MVKRTYIRVLALGGLFLVGKAYPMVDLHEELLAAPEYESLGIITQSAGLSEVQKEAIQAALA